MSSATDYISFDQKMSDLDDRSFRDGVRSPLLYQLLLLMRKRVTKYILYKISFGFLFHSP